MVRERHYVRGRRDAGATFLRHSISPANAVSGSFLTVKRHFRANLRTTLRRRHPVEKLVEAEYCVYLSTKKRPHGRRKTRLYKNSND